MAFVSVPQSAASHAANLLGSPLGALPKAEAFSSAAISCCSSCILAWSSADRLAPVLVLEMSLQKAPVSLPSVLSSLVQMSLSPIWESMPEPRAAKPSNFSELRVGGPEALGTGHTVAGVLEHASYGIAFLEINGCGLCI
jgi:hypothetical protein